MKKIEIKNLRSGQMVEAKHNVIDSHGDLIYKEWNLYTFSKLENLPYYSVKTEDGYSNIVDDDYLNEHFRLPVLTEGKEYECVKDCEPLYTKGKMYKYLNEDNTEVEPRYCFQDNIDDVRNTADEVFETFGIDVREEEKEDCCTNCGSELHYTNMCPTISDTPKPEASLLIKDLYLVRNYFGENDKTTFEHFAFKVIESAVSRIKELEGENETLKNTKEYLKTAISVKEDLLEELRNELQALKANGQPET